MIYLGLGTNLGDKHANLSIALSHLQAAQVNVVRQSSLYETKPVDVLNQPWFLNMVVECETKLFPLQLLQKVMRIERQMGRDRSSTAVRRGPRLIDIDILLFNNAVIHTPRLDVPHPRMTERRFVLEPLLELAPDLKDPRTRQPFSQLLPGVKDQSLSRLPNPNFQL